MIKKIIFSKEFDESKKMFFEECSLDELPDSRFVPLFGPNGSGKTTFINCVGSTLQGKQRLASLLKSAEDDFDKDFYNKDMRRELKRRGCEVIFDTQEDYKILSYSNSEDNFRHRKSRSIYDSFDPFLINARFDANSVSEGQSILYSVYGLFNVIREYNEDNPLYILIDELDSGLSIDNIDTCMRKLKNAVGKRENIQVIFSFNNPRILKHFHDVISMYDGKHIVLHNEDDMLTEMRRNKAWFDKKRKKSDGSPKVFD